MSAIVLADVQPGSLKLYCDSRGHGHFLPDTFSCRLSGLQNFLRNENGFSNANMCSVHKVKKKKKALFQNKRMAAGHRVTGRLCREQPPLC